MPFLNVNTGGISGNGKGKKLTAKMHEFIDLYMLHMNATKAMELSSYKTKNPTQQAVLLMKHPLIQKEIEARLKARAEKSEVKAEYLIQKLIAIIEGDQIKTSDQLKAIELVGKSIALWKERQEISGPDGAAIRHEESIKESVATFSSRISGLAKRAGTDNVVVFPERSGDSGT